MAIIQTIPGNFATNVIRNIFIRVKFDVTLDRSTIKDHTVILVETDNPNNIVSGRVDYIVGTKEVTFQVFDYLKKNTHYTVILVGGINGIYKLTPTREPFSNNNFTFLFTTGETIDNTIPLATQGKYEDGPYFTGEGGIYRETFGRTGEPVSHIVTTAAQVSPSGKIVPIAAGPDPYLPPSGDYDVDSFEFVSSVPENGSTKNTGTSIKLTFNSDIKSVGSVLVSVIDLLGIEPVNENNMANYSFQISDKDYIITPSGSTAEIVMNSLRLASDYEVTLTDVVDVIDRTISSLKIGFRTKVTPLYSTSRIIRINLGSLIAQIEDSEINEIIYENSLWAYSNAKVAFEIDDPPDAARSYVTCKTKLDLLERYYIKSGSIKSKQLADLRIEYGPAIVQMIQRKADKLEACAEKNALILTTGAGYVKARTAEKSYFDPRRPNSSWTRLNNDGSFAEGNGIIESLEILRED